MVCSTRFVLYFALIAMSVGCQRLPLAVETTSSSGGGGGTDTDGGGGADTDGGEIPGDVVFECDPMAQDCPNNGEKCAPILSSGAQNLYTCVQDSGGLTLFDPCTPDPATGVDQCAPGLVCLDDANGVGLCLELCLSETDCEQALCLDDPFERVPYCALECDPFNPLCAPGVDCRRERDRFTCKFAEDGDDGFVLDPCDSGTDEGCGSGVVCIPGALIPGCEAAGCCTPVCNSDDDQSLAECQSALDSAAASCVPLFVSPAPGFEGYGACLVPA